MSNQKPKVTFLEILKIMIKRVRLSTLILLLITSVSTSFAWFIYATKISASIEGHVITWNILFSNEDNEIAEYINFVIPNLVPGMDDYTDSVQAYNLGESDATISYELISATIMGTTYTVDGTTLTSTQLENMLYSSYPFTIDFNLTNTNISPVSGLSTFTLNVSWPYESGNDALDTYWGQRAYTYSANNPGSPSITISVRVAAIQNNPSP